MNEVIQVIKRFMVMMLIVATTLTFLPLQGLAGMTVFSESGSFSGLMNKDIGLSFDGNVETNPWVADGTDLFGAVRSSGGRCGTDYYSTLTITNKRQTSATLSFDYVVVPSGGTIQIDGNDISTNGSFSKELAAGGSIKVYIKSKSASADTKITMSNISLVLDVTATTIFHPAENGSYTVDGVTVGETISRTQSSRNAYNLVATPSQGSTFMGFYNLTTQTWIASEPNILYNGEADAEITAIFAENGVGVFETDGKLFTDLNEAIRVAQETNNNVVTLVGNGTLSGNYTIPTGVTLLIPFDSAHTLYKGTPQLASQSTQPATKGSVYKKLTLTDGSSLSVNGEVSIGGRLRSANGSSASYIAGAYGQIELSGSSHITVENGGSLYAWGFVTGDGTVTAKSGSNVHEWFQITDFRGGNNTLNMVGNDSKVFPLNQYYIQNIECALCLESGSKEDVYTGIYANSSDNAAGITFIGTGGMFNIKSGSLTKKYDGSKDRMIYSIDGSAELKPLALSLSGMSFNSANYVLPITNNMTVNVCENSTFTVNQSAALLPGAVVRIAQGGNMILSNGYSMYIYDGSDWGNYAREAKFNSIVFAPSKSYNRTASDLKDVELDINGTLVANGSVYTTAGGADITSSEGTGVYSQAGNPGTEANTYMYNMGSSATIPITAAKLHNADDSFTETANADAGSVIKYKDGIWGGLSVTFDANGGEGSMDPQEVHVSTDAPLNQNTFTRDGFEFDGWNTAADGSGTAYADGATINITEDTTLYAQWKGGTFTVTWVNDDSTVLETDENVAGGTTPTYDGQTPTKKGNAQYSYTFNGWDPEISPVAADTVYKATYKQNTNTYTITWKNSDGTVLATDNVAYGEKPAYTGELPKKAGDAEHSYAFNGWTPEIKTVTGDATYTATYTESINKYTVIWENWDRTVLQKDEGVGYGTIPRYTGSTPTKAGDTQYSYTFSGWTPEVSSVTREITYTATYTETVNEYEITWKNEDGSVIKTDSVKYGQKPVYSGEAPVKAATEQYSYVFTGWTPEIEAVTGNASYTAVFTEELNKYTVIWKNSDEDGTILETDIDVEYGAKPHYDGKTPEKEEDAQYTYTFSGWDPEVSAVKGDITYTAVYKTTTKTYTVTWKNYDGTVLETDTDVEYGTVPAYNGETPVRPADNVYSYSFAGWSKDGSTVEGTGTVDGDMTFIAVFTGTELVKYTVSFEANGGSGSMDPQTYIEGQELILAANGFTREGYSFTGWNTKADGSGVAYGAEGSVTDLTGDLILYAQWKHDDGWFTDDNGKQYYSNGELQKTGWTTIDGKLYYLDTETGYAACDGIYYLPRQEGDSGDAWDAEHNRDGYVAQGYDKNCYFIFDKDGVFASDTNGMYLVSKDAKIAWRPYLYTKNYVPTFDGDHYVWAVNGQLPRHPGLVEWEGSHYYFPTQYFELGKSYVTNSDYYVSRTNDYVSAGVYSFDKDGKLVVPEDSFTGLKEEDGNLYYYKDGSRFHAGLIKIDGYYYYIKSNGSAVRSPSADSTVRYYVSNVNDTGFKSAYYCFDNEGKMVTDGLVKESDGTIAYYKNGVRTHAGLIKVDGAYYYIKSNGTAVRSTSEGATIRYYVSNVNDTGVPVGYYEFDSDGKMVMNDDPATPKNGLVKESDGTISYYVDGVRTHAGLINVDGSYYYIKSNGTAVKSNAEGETIRYYVSNPNDTGMAKDWYYFDFNGKMIVD